MPAETRHAETRARRNAAWLVACAVVLGVVLVLAFGDPQPALQAWIASQLDAPGGIGGTLVAVMVLAILPIVAAGIYLFLLGGRSVRDERFPPPGFAAVRDARVVEGAAARWRGRVVQALALILVLTALLLPAMVWWLARSLQAMN